MTAPLGLPAASHRPDRLRRSRASAARRRPPPSTTSRAASAASAELAEYALTIVALRRAGRELAAVPVPARIRRGRASRTAAAARPLVAGACRLGSMLTATAITALLIVPELGPRPRR